VLVIMGGVFVIETLSVMIQVASFKLTGKRVFRMAPIHHHFELEGLAGAARDRALLDHLGDAGAGRPRHVEGALMTTAHAAPGHAAGRDRRPLRSVAARHGDRARVRWAW
jgi:hypothetical protein